MILGSFLLFYYFSPFGGMDDDEGLDWMEGGACTILKLSFLRYTIFLGICLLSGWEYWNREERMVGWIYTRNRQIARKG